MTAHPGRHRGIPFLQCIQLAKIHRGVLLRQGDDHRLQPDLQRLGKGGQLRLAPVNFLKQHIHHFHQQRLLVGIHCVDGFFADAQRRRHLLHGKVYPFRLKQSCGGIQNLLAQIHVLPPRKPKLIFWFPVYTASRTCQFPQTIISFLDKTPLWKLGSIPECSGKPIPGSPMERAIQDPTA